ncbi:UNVERIFIED_CONTAM: hypothetical protein Scaly_0436800 [Sesamum calycinum]|uniref:Uncharacterized protein n=1 Tax=Sesamum calycinum TaxID=2727403 RepID=A0AAW2SEA7_9LAMI
MDIPTRICKTLLISSVVLYLAFISLSNRYPNCPPAHFFTPTFLKISSPSPPSSSPTSNITRQSTSSPGAHSPTLLSHLAFGIIGSEDAWHHRRSYIESWWRPNATHGLLFLDQPPSENLLPWSPESPPYRISRDLRAFLNKSDVTPQRIANGIAEVFREVDHANLRWLVMGDDDSIFFLDNLVEMLQRYDHTKYYYIGARSEFVLSNFLFSFSQGFGGAGFILSYPLAKDLVRDMDNCLMRYSHVVAADQTTMSCVADMGVNLTPLEGFHQIDLRGDISGLLSSHPKVPLLSLHHFDMVEPIPNMNRSQSTLHLMRAAKADQSRMLQQTICHYRRRNWSFSIAWGYSAHIYERIMPRSLLQYPIETFQAWLPAPGPPFYMFNTRLPSTDPCEAPHVFFLDTVKRKADDIVTVYRRAWPRGMPPCFFSGNHSADYIHKIRVTSPAKKRLEIHRSECCDIVGITGNKADVKFRECMSQEIMA